MRASVRCARLAELDRWVGAIAHHEARGQLDGAGGDPGFRAEMLAAAEAMEREAMALRSQATYAMWRRAEAAP